MRPRRDDQPQIGREVSREICQGVERRLRQEVRAINDQNRAGGGLSDFGEPKCDVFETSRTGRFEQRAAEFRPSGAQSKRQYERLRETLGFVDVLRREPRHDFARGEKFAPPFRH